MDVLEESCSSNDANDYADCEVVDVIFESFDVSHDDHPEDSDNTPSTRQCETLSVSLNLEDDETSSTYSPHLKIYGASRFVQQAVGDDTDGKYEVLMKGDKIKVESCDEDDDDNNNNVLRSREDEKHGMVVEEDKIKAEPLADHDTKNNVVNSYNDSLEECKFFEGPIGYGKDTTSTASNHYPPRLCYSCPVCHDVVGNSIIELEIHRKEVHNTPHWCKICKKCLGSKKTLSDHMMRHIRYPCTCCSQEFRHLLQLEDHQAVHYKVKIYKCERCGEDFYLEASLKHHNSFMGKRCPEIQRNIERITHIVEEEKKKQIEKSKESSNICKVTPRVLKNSGSVTVRKHQCPRCEKVYTQRHNLISHMRNYHTKYRCTECVKKYTQRHTLVTHMRRHHPGVSPPREVPMSLPVNWYL